MNRYILSLCLLACSAFAFAQKPATPTKALTRGDTEKSFIQALSNDALVDSVNFVIDTDSLVPYGDQLYILPGTAYQNADIRNSVYVRKQKSIEPVWSTSYPKESMANMFLFPSDLYYKVPVHLKIMKHEYGVQEDVTTTVGKLLAVAKHEGCQPYWGVEQCDSVKLVGALFLYNAAKGYVHVLNVTCNPTKVIAHGAAVNARTSLYVPTNNISKLIAPYKKKKASQIIKYDKK